MQEIDRGKINMSAILNTWSYTAAPPSGHKYKLKLLNWDSSSHHVSRQLDTKVPLKWNLIDFKSSYLFKLNTMISGYIFVFVD